MRHRGGDAGRLTMNFIGIDPIRALFWTAVLKRRSLQCPYRRNHVMPRLGRRVMRQFVVSGYLRWVG